MQHPPNIIEEYATNFTLSDKNADPDNWKWRAESKATWTPAEENWQKFSTDWYGAATRPSSPPESPSLSLEPLPDLDRSISSQLLVRDSYVTMFNTVWARAMSSEGSTGVIITGQPGIGKTLFLYYLLVRLLQRKQVVLFCPDGEGLYLFYHNKVYAADIQALNIHMSLPTPISNSSNVFIWSLFDINEPRQPRKFLVKYPCLPVQTASPNPIRYQIWKKEQRPLLTGLPLWTRDELAQGLRHQRRYDSLLAALQKVYTPNLPVRDPLDGFPGARALLEEHYSEENSVQPSPEDALNYLLDAAIDRFGYSARDVFSAVFNYPEVTEDHKGAFRITYANLCDTVSALTRQQTSNFISDQILALSPVDQGPLWRVHWEVDFKSSWVAKSVIRELGDAVDTEIRQGVCELRRIPGARALVGWMLEPLAHHYIMNPTNEFPLFNMNSNGADPPHFTLVQDSPVPDHERFIKVKRELVRLQSIANLSSCLGNNLYVPDNPNFPLFDAFIIDLKRAEKSAILWVLQITTSRKHGGSAKGYQKIREIIAILKDELREGSPSKKRKTAAVQATPLVQVRYLLVVPKDEHQSQNLQWDFPKGWNQDCQKNDHRGKVYCLEIPV